MKEKTTFIYALCDPVSLEVRYVGKADDPYKRYCKHLIDRGNTHKAHWIQALLRRGLLPIRQILEECDELIWKERETNWIEFYKKIGAPLTNGTDGGDGFTKEYMIGKKHALGCKRTDTWKLNMSKRMLGNKSGEGGKGKIVSQETKDKLSKLNLGRKMTEETKEKIRKSSSLLLRTGNKNPMFGISLRFLRCGSCKKRKECKRGSYSRACNKHEAKK